MSLHIGYPSKPTIFSSVLDGRFNTISIPQLNSRFVKTLPNNYLILKFQFSQTEYSILFQTMLNFFTKTNFIFWKFQSVYKEYYFCQTCYSTRVFHIILLSCSETFQNIGPVLDPYIAAKCPYVRNAPLLRAPTLQSIQVRPLKYHKLCMVMSKDQVLTEIRDLKVGAKGVLNYRKAPVHGLYAT